MALNDLLRKLLGQIYRAGIVQMPPESKLLIQSEAGDCLRKINLRKPLTSFDLEMT